MLSKYTASKDFRLSLNQMRSSLTPVSSKVQTREEKNPRTVLTRINKCKKRARNQVVVHRSKRIFKQTKMKSSLHQLGQKFWSLHRSQALHKLQLLRIKSLKIQRARRWIGIFKWEFFRSFPLTFYMTRSGGFKRRTISSIFPQTFLYAKVGQHPSFLSQVRRTEMSRSWCLNLWLQRVPRLGLMICRGNHWSNSKSCLWFARKSSWFQKLS